MSYLRPVPFCFWDAGGGDFGGAEGVGGGDPDADPNADGPSGGIGDIGQPDAAGGTGLGAEPGGGREGDRSESVDLSTSHETAAPSGSLMGTRDPGEIEMETAAPPALERTTTFGFDVGKGLKGLASGVKTGAAAGPIGMVGGGLLGFGIGGLRMGHDYEVAGLSDAERAGRASQGEAGPSVGGEPGDPGGVAIDPASIANPQALMAQDWEGWDDPGLAGLEALRRQGYGQDPRVLRSAGLLTQPNLAQLNAYRMR